MHHNPSGAQLVELLQLVQYSTSVHFTIVPVFRLGKDDFL